MKQVNNVQCLNGIEERLSLREYLVQISTQLMSPAGEHQLLSPAILA